MDIMMSILVGVLAVVITFGLAVAFHEFGHMMFALFCKVPVDSFALGMGPRIVSWKWKGIDFSLRWLPVGGFVKLGDPNPPEGEAGAEPSRKEIDEVAGADADESGPDQEKKDMGDSAYEDMNALQGRGLIPKLLVFGGGLFMNFVAAVLAMTLLLVLPIEVALTPFAIEQVPEQTYPYQQGFRSGDRVVSVNGQPVDYLRDYQEAIDQALQQQSAPETSREAVDLVLTVRRDRGQRQVTLTQVAVKDLDACFEGVQWGSSTVIGNVKRNTPAEAAGLRVGDRITTVAGEPVRTFRHLNEVLAQRRGERVTLEVERDGEGIAVEVAIPESAGQEPARALGMVSRTVKRASPGWMGRMLRGLTLGHFGVASGPPLLVESVEAGSRAQGLGLQPGDRIVSADARPVFDMAELTEVARRVAGQPRIEFAVGVEREGASEPVRLDFGRITPTKLDVVFQQITLRTPPMIAAVFPNHPAEDAGLKAGDRILAVNGHPVQGGSEVSQLVSPRLGESITLTVEREGEKLQKQLTPVEKIGDPTQGWLGIQMGSGIKKTVRRFENPVKAAMAAPGYTWMQLREIVGQTVGFFAEANFQQVRRNLGGPVMIIALTARMAQQGFAKIVNWFIVLNLLLLIFNLLPLPVLDGGFLLISVIESIIRRPIPPRILTPIFTFFAILLISFVVLITLQDIINLVT